MAGSAERMRGYQGPAMLSFGFRPFFLLGGLWAAAAMLLWIAMLAGRVALPSAFDPLEWHVHELLYGYLPAVVAGFLMIGCHDHRLVNVGMHMAEGILSPVLDSVTQLAAAEPGFRMLGLLPAPG